MQFTWSYLFPVYRSKINLRKFSTKLFLWFLLNLFTSKENTKIKSGVLVRVKVEIKGQLSEGIVHMKMIFISILLLQSTILADLIGWNRYSGLIIIKNRIENSNFLPSHQDEIIQYLVKRGQYADLRQFLQIARNSDRQFRQKRIADYKASNE